MPLKKSTPIDQSFLKGKEEELHQFLKLITPNCITNPSDFRVTELDTENTFDLRFKCGKPKQKPKSMGLHMKYQNNELYYGTANPLTNEQYRKVRTYKLDKERDRKLLELIDW
jgi:hypothetical protein